MNSASGFGNILLIIALTTDSFVVSFAYGMSRLNIPFLMIVTMNLVMVSILGTAVFAGGYLAKVIPTAFTGWISVILLTGMGIYHIYACLQGNESTRKTEKKLSLKESVILAVVLSFDSVAVGLGTGLLDGNKAFLLVGTFIGGIAMMEAGWLLGRNSGKIIEGDFSWLSGVCLLLLALGTICSL